MESINTILERIKNTKGSQIGPIINKIKRNNECLKEIEDKTSFLNSSYEKISLAQRIYHIVFDILKIEKCTCGKPKEFTKYDRFSNDRNKKDSNYYGHCGKIECLLKEFKENTGGKQAYGALIHKISGDVRYRKQLLERTDFLDPHYSNLSDSQRFYHIFFGFYQLETCPYCNENKKFTFNSKFSEIRYDKVDANYYGTCGKKKCMNIYTVSRMKEGMIDKYGFDNIWEIPGYREGLESTNLKKYGVKSFMGTPEFRKKCQETYDKNWGGEHPTSLQLTKDKKYKTNIEKYGFKCALQNPEIYDKHLKSCYSTKEYTMPSGKIINVQGYEPWALDRILENNYETENNIVTDKQEIIKILGNFQYINEHNLISCYFPDIYLLSHNKIIEVKSKYTHSINIEENNRKRESVINKGLIFEFWIFDNNRNLVIV